MKIAIIEDEQKLADSLKLGLMGEKYEVDVFYDAESAEQGIKQSPFQYDLLLLDLMLPYKSGLELCKDLRNVNFASPILVLSARDATDDKVKALDCGVDDFMTKPFSFDELLARVRALLRRPSVIHAMPLKVGEVTLDPVARSVLRGEQKILLTMTEFDLLHFLMEREGKVVPREEIFAHLWHTDAAMPGNVVDVHIRNLRKKIDDPYVHKIIQTVRGVGYMAQA